MKKDIAIVKKSTGAKNGQPECNYSNNYYGDQVCVLRGSCHRDQQK